MVRKDLSRYGYLSGYQRFEGLETEETRELIILELILAHKLETFEKILSVKYPSHQMFQGEYISSIKKILDEYKEYLVK